MFRNDKFIEKHLNKKLEYSELKSLTAMDLIREEARNDETVVEYFMRQKDDIYMDQYLEENDEFIINRNNKSQPTKRSNFEPLFDKWDKTPFPIKTKRRCAPEIISNLLTHKQFEDIYDHFFEILNEINPIKIEEDDEEELTLYSKEFHLVTEHIEHLNYIIRYLYKKENFKHLFVFCRKLLCNLELHIFCNFKKEVQLEMNKLPEITVDYDPFNQEYYYFMRFNNFIIKELIKDI